MIFDNDENLANEEVLFEGKPSFIFACKSIILGIIAIAFILGSAFTILSSISELQVYTIDFIQQPIDQFVAIIIYCIVFLIFIWIIFKLLKWYSISYMITNKRIISKKGIIRQKKSYMSFRNIQDINVSQSIIQKLFGVGTIEIMSAYDNSDVVFKYVHYPKDIEEIIFDGMNTLSSSPLNNDYENYQNYDNERQHGSILSSYSNHDDYYHDNRRYGNSYQENNHYPNSPYDEFSRDYSDGSAFYSDDEFSRGYSDGHYQQESRRDNYRYEPNIKESYMEENYPEYENNNYGLSNKPLSNSSENEIYYNDYQDPTEFDDTINQVMRNNESNLKFKGNKNSSNINYQGYSHNGSYETPNTNQSYQGSNMNYQGYSHNGSYETPNTNQNYNISENQYNNDSYPNETQYNQGYYGENHYDGRIDSQKEYYSGNSHNSQSEIYHPDNQQFNNYNERNPKKHYNKNKYHNKKHYNRNRNYDEIKEDAEKVSSNKNSHKTRDSVLAKHDRKFKL